MQVRGPSRPETTSDASAWCAIAFLVVAVLGLQLVQPMRIQPSSLVGLAIACGALFTAAAFYRNVRPRQNFAEMCVALAQVILFSALGVALSYMLARGDGALWDERLGRWDGYLGFDWLSYLRWVDQSAALTAVLRISYASLIPQIIVLVLALGFTGRVRELRIVMLGAIICGTICILVSAFFPAVSNPAHLGLTGRDFQHVNPWAGYLHLADLRALRDGSFTALHFGSAQGIITFPSYHAGLSLVTMWGFWKCGPVWLRGGGMTIAALTIAATPVDGGHYLVDVLAGLAIAAVSLPVASRVVRWAPVWRGFTASPFRRSHAASGL
jgi:hypothetical protein